MANKDTISILFQKELRRLMSDKPRMPFSLTANFEYEGQLRQAGDTVVVSISPKIEMVDKSSENGGDLRKTSLGSIAISDRNIKKSELKVDKMHEYGEAYSTLEEIQTAYSIGSERMKDLKVAMDTVVEKGIIQVVDAMLLANTGNVLTASATLTVENIAENIMALRTAMSKKEIPMEGRRLIVSPKISALIAMSKILNGTEDASKSAIEGWLGRFAGFDIFESNFINEDKLYAIHNGAVNYVRQAVNAKIAERTDGFAFNMLGQVVHGGKVFDSNIERVFAMNNV